MRRPALSRSAIMKAAHARIAASRAFLADLAAKGFREPAATLARFSYSKAFADALSFACASRRSRSCPSVVPRWRRPGPMPAGARCCSAAPPRR